MEKQRLERIRDKAEQLIRSLNSLSDSLPPGCAETTALQSAALDIYNELLLFNHAGTEARVSPKSVRHIEESIASLPSPPSSGATGPDVPAAERVSTPPASSSSSRSLYDQIGDGITDRSLGSKLQQSKVTDLARAIGINQRFTFIQELFEHDAAAFAESVKHLNSLPGWEEAEEFMVKTLAPRFKWDMEAPLVQEMFSLVRRRYS